MAMVCGSEIVVRVEFPNGDVCEDLNVSVRSIDSKCVKKKNRVWET
jgi:hypothetical protein